MAEFGKSEERTERVRRGMSKEAGRVRRGKSKGREE